MTRATEPSLAKSPPATGTPTGLLVVERSRSRGVLLYTHALCANLAGAGVDLTLLSPRRPMAPSGFPYPVRPTLRLPRGSSRIVAVLLNAVRVLRAAIRTRSNVVLFQAEPGPLDAFLVRTLHLLHRRVLWAVHNPLSPASALPPRRVRRLLKRVDVIVTGTDALRNDLATVAPDFEGKLVTVPYGDFRFATGPTPTQASARHELGIARRAATLLWFPVRKVDPATTEVLEVLRTLRSRGVPVTLLVAGSDPEAAASLTRAAEAEGLSGFVRFFPGNPDPCDAATLFAAADACLVIDAGFGPEIVQLSYAYARPVIATPGSGLAEEVRPGAGGAIAEGDDAASLADAVQGLAVPRRLLEQHQRRLATNPPNSHGWAQAVGAYLGLLAFDDVATGRRLSAEGSGNVIRWIWSSLLVLVIFLIGAATTSNVRLAPGLSINPALILAIAIPAGIIFLVVVPFDAKVIVYFLALIWGNFFRRVLHPMPLQLVPSLIAAACLFHLFLESPKVPGYTKNTRLFHAVLILLAGWNIAEVFNPNIVDILGGLRGLRVLIEPIIAYGLMLVYFRNRENVRLWIWLILIFGGIAMLWAVKITAIGYSGFEQKYIEATDVAGTLVGENRNMGTMSNPMSWGLLSLWVMLFAVAVLLEDRRFPKKWLLVILVPLAGLCVMTTGNRILLFAAAVALPAMIACAIGARATRFRAGILLIVVAVAGIFLWSWIPNQVQISSGGFARLNPIEVMRQKLARLKDPGKETKAYESRLDRTSEILEIIPSHPFGGGTGMNVPGSTGDKDQLSVKGLGKKGTSVIPVFEGDFFYVNYLAESGAVGLILLLLVFVLALLMTLAAYSRLRTPLYRAITLTSVARMIALLINNVTNNGYTSNETSSFYFALVALTVCLPRIERLEMGDPDLAGDTRQLALFR